MRPCHRLRILPTPCIQLNSHEMKNFIPLLLFLLPAVVSAQTKPVKIVFDVTSKDSLTHQAVLRHVKGMAKAYPDAMLEVVIYGSAWPMVVNGKSSSNEVVEKLAEEKNVAFKLCGITMERFKIHGSDVVKGVDVVPDAIIQIVTRQGEGWGYIKESHN
jgi:uncharacterized protein